MFIDVNIMHDTASIPNPVSISKGSKGYYFLKCSFTEEWNELNKFAIFPEYNCSVVFSDNELELPEALIDKRGWLKVGFLGKDSDGSIRISTNTITIKIKSAVGEEDSAPPSPIEESTWDSYIGDIAQGYIDEMTVSAESVKEASENISNAVANCLKGGYVWYVDTDTVVDGNGSEVGALKDLETDDYYGSMIFVLSSTSSAYPPITQCFKMATLSLR